MACRTGCKTKDHTSWAECARDAGIRTSIIATSSNRDGFEQTNRDLKAYREARSEGIQPEGTTMDKIVAAKAATANMGRPYNANIDPPASMIVNRKAGEFVTRGESA